MSANCEKLRITLTGYECLDLINALNSKIVNIEKKVFPNNWSSLEESLDDWKKLKKKIERAYHNNKRI